MILYIHASHYSTILYNSWISYVKKKKEIIQSITGMDEIWNILICKLLPHSKKIL